MLNIKKLPHVSAPFLTLGASVFVVLAYNGSFWKTFFSAIGGAQPGNLPVYLGTFVALVLLFNAMLTLVNFRFVIKPVLIVLFLAASAASHFMNRYGVVIDASMVQNVVETDPKEAHELFSWQMLQTVTLLGIVPSLCVWFLPLRFPPMRRDLLVKSGTLMLSLLAVAALLIMLFKTLAPAVREHRELRFLLTPTNMVQATRGYLKRRWATPAVIAPLGTDAGKGTRWAASGRRTVTIIVVGETARSVNFSLNGYARQTNPLLAMQPGLVNFRDVGSCGTATAVSVPCVFSDLGRDAYTAERASSREGLLDVLKHAGFDVLWRDNNSGCKGACDRVRFEDVSHPVADDPLCDADECYDERLLRDLPQTIHDARNDLVIVLHQKGSHGPAYWKRYPKEFERFGPVCRTIDMEQCSRESIVAAYDNTILYTDHVLSKTIDLLRAAAVEEGVDTAMLYFSDHGESLGESNMYLHGAPYILSPPEQREVPMMLWLSDGFLQRFRIDRTCLAARSTQEFSHDNVFHSVLGMLNVSTAVYNPKLDVFHPCSRDN